MNIEIGDNLKNWTIICALLAVLTVGVAIGHFLVPLPDAKIEERRGKANLASAVEDVKKSKEKLEELELGVTGMWEGAAESVTSQILQSVTLVAKTNGLNLKSFRPQNAVADGDVSRNNYVVLIEGPFPNVVQFVRSVDTPASRLGVSLVQISAANQETDEVNATIGIIAYVKMPDPKDAAAPVKNQDPNIKKTMNDSGSETSQPKETNQTDGTKE